MKNQKNPHINVTLILKKKLIVDHNYFSCSLRIQVRSWGGIEKALKFGY